MARCTLYNIMWKSLTVTCDRSVVFFPGTPVSFTSKIIRHDITEILLKVALNTINQTKCNTSQWHVTLILVNKYALIIAFITLYAVCKHPWRNSEGYNYNKSKFLSCGVQHFQKGRSLVAWDETYNATQPN